MKFWTDNWLDYNIADKVGIAIDASDRFSQLIREFRSENGWVLGDHFVEEHPTICADIVAVKITSMAKDELVWIHQKSGKVTSLVAYNVYRAKFPTVKWGSWIWGSFIPSARLTLIWRLIWSKLPTAEVLASWGILGPSICIFCMINSETTDHIFCSCVFAESLIHKIIGLFGVSIDVSFGFHDIFLQIVRKEFSCRTNKVWRIAWITFFWMLWGARNIAVHKNERPRISSFPAQLIVYVQKIDGGGIRL